MVLPNHGCNYKEKTVSITPSCPARCFRSCVAGEPAACPEGGKGLPGQGGAQGGSASSREDAVKR